MSHQRMQVNYRGHVQGVGFRYTARQIADRFTVAGCVRNLPDGSVELIAEGDPAELERFLAEIQSEMRGYISEVETRQAPATGEFRSFEITR